MFQCIKTERRIITLLLFLKYFSVVMQLNNTAFQHDLDSLHRNTS